MRARLLLPAAVVLATAAAADTPAPGFAVTPLPVSPDVNHDPFGLSFDVHGVGIELANGDLVGFDGSRIVRRDPTGALLATYHSLADAVYPSLIAVDAGESTLVCGESSTGRIFRVALASGATDVLATIPFNYDGAFDAAGDLYVSHGAGMFGGGTAISRVELATGAVTPVASLSGPSGPLAIDSAGGLVYGLVAANFVPGASRLVRFDAGQLASGVLLHEGDAATVSTGWDNVAFVAEDRETGTLFLIENDGLGPPEVWRARDTKQRSVAVARGPVGTFMSNLQVDPSPGPSVFDPFQPADGGRLRYNLSDFPSGTLVRYVATPVRPVTTLAGPGTSGPGLVTLGVSGARPGGTAVFWYAGSFAVQPVETVYHLPDLPPLFWSFADGTSFGIPFFLPVDANGEASLGFYNPGDLTGAIAFHAMVADASIVVEGTGTVAEL